MDAHPPRLHDPDLPAVEILLGRDARHVLDTVFQSGGGAVGEFRPRQVTWWPGRSITVRYEVRDPDGAPLPQVVAVSGSIPEGAVVLESDEARIGLWTVPHDPALPGLASVLDGRILGAMLDSIGAGGGDPVARLRAYRPGRRAVVQVDTGAHRVFVKVGRPTDVRRLHDTHRLLSGSLPVPTSLGYDADLGVLVMPAGRGVTLRQALDTDTALPPAAAVAALVDGLPSPLDSGRTRSSIRKVVALAGLLTRIVPTETDRIERLVDALGDERELSPAPVHGDFHDGQILVEGGRITGLLDVDTHSFGIPADDPGTMMGHLLSRRPHAPAAHRIDRYVADLATVWSSRFDGVELRRRAAAVMLGLATGPFRVQQADWPRLVADRIARAEVLLDDESSLIDVSGRSHAGPAS